ncbi:Hypothetical protein CAP_1664 [Chondromyces apiculatus DSM 436]|uniref:Uncharacterized protein n=1 Tax=Chondromyces apiculatus DSM 436 TaxID=1192034 RepID=A0A017TBF2_9BACT|nr:Hypothetical protein CAP_1664 [Chondromyces apiculatus DSM 436]
MHPAGHARPCPPRPTLRRTCAAYDGGPQVRSTGAQRRR